MFLDFQSAMPITSKVLKSVYFFLAIKNYIGKEKRNHEKSPV